VQNGTGQRDVVRKNFAEVKFRRKKGGIGKGGGDRSKYLKEGEEKKKAAKVLALYTTKKEKAGKNTDKKVAGVKKSARLRIAN